MKVLLLLALLGGAEEKPTPDQSTQQSEAQNWSCTPRKTCGKIRSCEEARWYLENCPWGGKLDNDDDGYPCEALCGSGN